MIEAMNVTEQMVEALKYIVDDFEALADEDVRQTGSARIIADARAAVAALSAASALSQAEGSQDERALFEEWADKDNQRLDPQEFEEPTPGNNHYYLIDSTNDAYIGWCARAALPTRPREQEGAEPVAQSLTLKVIFVGEPTIAALRALKNVKLGSQGVVLMPASDLFEAALAHPLPAASFHVPEGWALVPLDPTPEMLRAYRGALKQYIDALPDDVRLPGKRGLIIDDTIKAQQRFKAMVAAAPTPPTTAASFQAGAEAMREAAAKHVLTYHQSWDLEPHELTEYGKETRKICEAISTAIRSLPIPASSEGR